MAPFAAAAPYIVGTTAVLGIQQADRIGKFNEDVQNRNAIIKENEAKILDDKLALDLSRFYKAFEKLVALRTLNEDKNKFHSFHLQNF